MYVNYAASPSQSTHYKSKHLQTEKQQDVNKLHKHNKERFIIYAYEVRDFTRKSDLTRLAPTLFYPRPSYQEIQFE